MKDKSVTSTALTMVYHDPAGRMLDQLNRTLPVIMSMFADVIVRASATANQQGKQLLKAAGAAVFPARSVRAARSSPAPNGRHRADGIGIGRLRRSVVELAFQHSAASHAIYCDADRVLHWAEFFPDEFRAISEAVRQFDFTVLGRTPRAFESHPRTQRDTETVINRLFGQVSGFSWNDVTSGARGVSRAAAEAIVANVEDDELSTDISWPLYLQHHDGWSIGYVETEGLEFETADRFADEVAAAGGYAAWLDRLENDPHEWAFRFDLARVEIEALLPYVRNSTS
jgi:hypothetical protein